MCLSIVVDSVYIDNVLVLRFYMVYDIIYLHNNLSTQPESYCISYVHCDIQSLQYRRQVSVWECSMTEAVFSS